jgi:hypothetical protein
MEGSPIPPPDAEAAANAVQLRIKLVETIGGSTCNLYGLDWAVSSFSPAESPDYKICIATHVDEEQISTHYVASAKRDGDNQLQFQPDGSVFIFDKGEWDAFVLGVEAGEFKPTGRRSTL